MSCHFIRAKSGKMSCFTTLITFLAWFKSTVTCKVSSFVTSITFSCWAIVPAIISSFLWAIPCIMPSLWAVVALFLVRTRWRLRAISGYMTSAPTCITYVSFFLTTIFCKVSSVATSVASTVVVTTNRRVRAFTCNMTSLIALVAKTIIFYIFKILFCAIFCNMATLFTLVAENFIRGTRATWAVFWDVSRTPTDITWPI